MRVDSPRCWRLSPRSASPAAWPPSPGSSSASWSPASRRQGAASSSASASRSCRSWPRSTPTDTWRSSRRFFGAAPARATSARRVDASTRSRPRATRRREAAPSRDSAGTLSKIVAQGDPAPAGGAFAGFGVPALNAAGAVAFAAVVEGRAVPGGVFVTSASRIRMLVGAGDETPIGGIFAKFSERVALNGAGAVAFTAALKEAPIAQAVFVVEGGRPRKVVAIGDAAPGGGVFSHFGLWPALSAGGAVGFTASVDRGVAEVAAFVSTATDLARIAAVGDALPGGGTLSSFGLYPALALSPSGGATFATAPSASGGGVEGIFLVPPARAR